MLWQARDFDHGSNFDGADLRMESGRRSRFVEILSIDQEEPAQLFTGFGKRSIGYQRFAVAEH